jgi:hypothetical protein
MKEICAHKMKEGRKRGDAWDGKGSGSTMLPVDFRLLVLAVSAEWWRSIKFQKTSGLGVRG